jgi:hypothetical protein
MQFEIGTIVTVVLVKSRYYMCQGDVVGITHDDNPEGALDVRFGKSCSHCFTDPAEEEVIVRFREEHLNQDAEWSLYSKIVRAFGLNAWRGVVYIKAPFDRNDRCQAEGCHTHVARRCLVKILWVVYELDLCRDCAPKYDGQTLDRFPKGYYFDYERAS